MVYLSGPMNKDYERDLSFAALFDVLCGDKAVSGHLTSYLSGLQLSEPLAIITAG